MNERRMHHNPYIVSDWDDTVPTILEINRRYHEFMQEFWKLYRERRTEHTARPRTLLTTFTRWADSLPTEE